MGGRRPWEAVFLEVLADTANVRHAAMKAGVSRYEVYRCANADPKFAEAMDDAKDQAMDALEYEAWRRAFAGVKRERWVRTGTDPNSKTATYEKVTITEYSDILLMFLLKGGRPEVYRENFDFQKAMAALAAHKESAPLTVASIAAPTKRKRSG